MYPTLNFERDYAGTCNKRSGNFITHLFHLDVANATFHLWLITRYFPQRITIPVLTPGHPLQQT